MRSQKPPLRLFGFAIPNWLLVVLICLALPMVALMIGIALP